jgi:hypothetical protein
LYGMGHIHVKDFKFRPPLPDDFHPKSSLCKKVDCFTVLESNASYIFVYGDV